MAGNSMKMVWKVFCRNSIRNSTKTLTMGFPGFVVNYSWWKIFSAQWSIWKVAIVVLFSAGLVISWISKLIQTPLQWEQWWWRECTARAGSSLCQEWNDQLSVGVQEALEGQHFSDKGWQQGRHLASTTLPWPSQGCSYWSRESVHTSTALYESQNVQTAWSRGGNWFWPNCTNTIKGNSSNAGSGCLCWSCHKHGNCFYSILLCQHVLFMLLVFSPLFLPFFLVKFFFWRKHY